MPDNILSRRGGSRTARPPNPTVIPSLPIRFPAKSLPPKHGVGNPSPLPTSHAERSGVGESRCPSPRCPRACRDPSLPIRCSHEELVPLKTGAATHPHHLPLSSRMRGPIPPSPDVITMKIARSAAANPFPLDGGRLEPALVKAGDGGEPRTRQHSPP